MNISSLKPGDIIEVDKKGRRFYAIVRAIEQGDIVLRPLGRETWLSATAREVVGVWHANKHTRARVAPDAQEAAA